MIETQSTEAQTAAVTFLQATIACLMTHDPTAELADERQTFKDLLQVGMSEFATPTPATLPCVKYLHESLKPGHATSDVHANLLKACADVAPFCEWRNKYQSGGSNDLVQRFGYCDVVGPDGYLGAEVVTLGLVLLGPQVFYPYHYHPARELYFVLSGTAEWGVVQGPTVAREPGSFILHTENQPHAMQTQEQSLLAISLWRGRIREGAKLSN